MAEPFKIPEIGSRPVDLDPKSTRAAGTPRLGQPDTPNFRETLTEAIGEVQRLQNEADTTIRQLVAGEIKDVTEAMVAVERADVSFQTMMAMRNRIVAAYEEVMRMQV